MRIRSTTLVMTILLLMMIGACGAPEPTATSVPPSATAIAIAPTDTPAPPTPTQVPPTETPLLPAATPLPPTSTPPPTDTPLPPTPTSPAPTATPIASSTFDGARVTFVHTAGFLITVGDKRILIDALYAGYPEAILKPVVYGYPPFDGVDLILATHEHGDHFSADLTLRYMTEHPETVFLSSQSAVDQVLAAGSGMRDRVIPIELESRESEQIAVDGIDLEIFYLSHGVPGLLNLGFLITVDGTRFFHTGDIDPGIVTASYLQSYGLPDKGIDVAFVPDFYLTMEEYHAHVLEGIQARYLIPMHYSPDAPPSGIEANFPNAFVFRDTMESWVLPTDVAATPTMAPTPQADVPQEGEILLSAYPEGDIGVMNADGSDWRIMLDRRTSGDIYSERHARWHPDGQHVSYVIDDFAQAAIWVMQSDGSDQRFLVGQVAPNTTHSWSPDGTRIAYVSTEQDICIVDLTDQTVTKLTGADLREEQDPDWSPDGLKLAFSATQGGNHDIYIINADGTDLTRITSHAAKDKHPDWSPDSTRIAFSSPRRDVRFSDILVIDLSRGTEEDGNVPVPLTADDVLDVYPDWSPDGSRIAYLSYELGAGHGIIFVIDAQGQTRVQLTDNSYHSPRWRP
jgi:L-ascorbate metabolism protein UlaG (beta-lactamase superfamily)